MPKDEKLRSQDNLGVDRNATTSAFTAFAFLAWLSFSSSNLYLEFKKAHTKSFNINVPV